MTFAGLSVGTEEISSPKDEKQNAPIAVATRIGMLIATFSMNNELMIKITVVIRVPYIIEETTSPKIIAHNFMGAETILSSVLIFVSQGIMPGVIEETVKKRLMPKSPGISDSGETCRLREKETNKKPGTIIPKTITGGRRK